MLLSNLDLLATAPGGVARLRELILTLAVQGKLVLQDPADEPASVLLTKIRAEKDRLMAEGKIRRDKPLAAIADEEKPFGLPVGWEWVRFGDVLDFQGGGQPPKSNFSEVPLPDYVQLIQIRDLGDKPQPVYIPRKLAAKFCTTSDVMVGRYGASVGKVFWGKEGAYNVALIKMVDEHQVFDRRFLFQLLLSPIGQSLFAGISRSAQDGFNKNDIEAKLIPLAPLAEQSRIVTRVEELMRLCDALEAKGRLEAAQHAQLVSTLLGALTASATAEELAEHWQRVAQHFDLLFDRPEAIDALEQTLLQLAVRGLLVPQDPTDEPAFQLLQRLSNDSKRKAPPIRREIDGPFGIPESWCWVNLEFLAESMSNGLYKPAKFYSESGTACVRMYNIQDGHLDFSKLMRLDVTSSELAQYRLEPGDLLINRVNSRELVGKSAVVSTHHEPLVYEAMNIRVRLLELVNMPSYVNLVLRTKRVREVFQGDAKQAVGQASINQTQVGGVAIPLPPLAEQSRIVTRVTALRRLCADLRQRLADAQTIQSHLAQALVDSTSSV